MSEWKGKLVLLRGWPSVLPSVLKYSTDCVRKCYWNFVSFAQRYLWILILSSTFRYKKILEEILKAGGNELVDNIKAFVEACK